MQHAPIRPLLVNDNFFRDFFLRAIYSTPLHHRMRPKARGVFLYRTDIFRFSNNGEPDDPYLSKKGNNPHWLQDICR